MKLFALCALTVALVCASACSSSSPEPCPEDYICLGGSGGSNGSGGSTGNTGGSAGTGGATGSTSSVTTTSSSTTSGTTTSSSTTASSSTSTTSSSGAPPTMCNIMIGANQTVTVVAVDGGSGVGFIIDGGSLQQYTSDNICCRGTKDQPAVVNLALNEQNPSCGTGVTVIAEPYCVVNGGGTNCKTEFCPSSSQNLSQPGSTVVYLNNSSQPDYAYCQ